MTKKFILVISCIVFYSAAAIAELTEVPDFAENHTAEIITTIQFQRTNVYNTLDLSEEQLQIINNIDRRRYNEIRPEIIKLSELVKTLDALANSNNCTIKKVRTIKKDFTPIQNELYNINRKYEIELQTVLTEEQNLAYKKVRKQMRKTLKKSSRYKN